MTTIKLTEADVANCKWTLVEVTPLYRRWVGHGDHPKTGLPITVQKTEHLADEGIQALNADERNVNDGRRWTAGMGSDKGGNVPMVHVARTPLNKFFAEVANRMDDDEHHKWWLNRDENQTFRTRRGKL